MKYGSVCSGIEAATVAWHRLGWEPAWFAEIDKFPSAVLAHHYPDTPNLGDMMSIPDEQLERITDGLLVGGTPCQSFSVAGLRRGLDDPRGNLALGFLRLVDRARPKWVVWENVPGVLSSGGGRDFGSFLGGLVKLGYGFAYRVLDAQYIRVDGYGRAVPQRRRRLFVVGCLGDWRRAAAVLLERQSMSGDSPPRRKAGAGVAPILEVGARTGVSTDDIRAGIGIGDDQDPMYTLQAGKTHGVVCMAHGQGNAETVSDGELSLTCNHEAPIVAHTLRAEGHDASEDGTGRGVPLVTAYQSNGNSGVDYTNLSLQGDISGTLEAAQSKGNRGQGVMEHGSVVRRLTPRECERLQGFEDDYTLVPYRCKPAKDGPRYKALGNSMAVNAMRWIGRRIEAVEAIGGGVA